MMRLKSKPRRILMTADTIGGVWTYSLELARGLGPHGVKIYLATMGAELSREQLREASELDNLHVIESRFKLEWMSEPWHDVSAAGDWLLGLQEEFAPDLVHLNGYSHAALPWNCPVMVAAHSCVCSWWFAVNGQHAPCEWNTYRQKVTQGLRAADMVVAPTQAMLACLEEHYCAVPNAKVIPNGRRSSTFHPAAKSELILTAGRLWDQAKNIGSLASIASDLPWPVYIAGETRGPDGTRVEFRKVHSLGRLSTRELKAWFAKASIYAAPAKYEPFGLSALEAGLAECALVLGDIPSLRQVWGDAAVYVSPSDSMALKRELRSLIADPSRRSEMGARARQQALQYSVERMTKGYLEGYATLLAPRKEVAVATPELAVCAS